VVSLDPASGGIAQNLMFLKNIFQALLRYRFNSKELEGDLAKSWTVSPDGLVYTFKLRDNIKWHKGFGKVTAHDVKFSFDRVMDSKTRSPYSGDVKAEVKEVKAVDDYTVEIHLKARSAIFLHNAARPRPVMIVCQKAVEKYGKDFARNPIGSGPFVFQSMTREQIVLTANKEYHEGSPKIDKIIYNIIPDMDTLVMGLQRGDFDMVHLFDREKEIQDRVKASGVKIKPVDRGGWYVVLLNHQFKPFTDVRVRRAIAHAIDRDMIIEHLFGGMAEKLDSLVPKGYFGYTEEGLRRYNFDPKKSKELLTEAGYLNGFEVTWTSSTSPVYLPLATVIQDQLKEVGIKVNLEVMDPPAWMKKMTSATAQISVIYPVRVPDADIPLTQLFHSAGFSPGYNGLMRYSKLDKEIDEARTEMDPGKRQRMYNAIQRQLMEDLPAIPLFMKPYLTAYWPHVSGIPDIDPTFGIDFYHLQLMEKK